MAKKLIQRYLPDPKSITGNRYLAFLGKAMHDPNLWHLNRRSAASAFFVGYFCGVYPDTLSNGGGCHPGRPVPL